MQEIQVVDGRVSYLKNPQVMRRTRLRMSDKSPLASLEVVDLGAGKTYMRSIYRAKGDSPVVDARRVWEPVIGHYREAVRNLHSAYAEFVVSASTHDI